MRDDQLTAHGRPNKRRRRARFLATALTVAAALSITPNADAATQKHQVKLNSTIFAAQVGSTVNGGSVFAGAVPDPKLGHGAIVYNTSGTTRLRVGFQEFFALGSIRGNGRVTLVPGTGGRATFTGSLKVTGGTGKYVGARGTLRTTGTINSQSMVMATLKGSITY